jgi:hypothetical protein
MTRERRMFVFDPVGAATVEPQPGENWVEQNRDLESRHGL